MSDELQPTPGFAFFDTRFGGPKFIECVDLPGVEHVADEEKGTVVVISGSNGQKYGPYRLAKEIMRGNGKLVFLAWKVGANNQRTKPLTKAELEQQNLDLMTRLATLEQQLKSSQPAAKK